MAGNVGSEGAPTERDSQSFETDVLLRANGRAAQPLMQASEWMGRQADAFRCCDSHPLDCACRTKETLDSINLCRF